jgi:uncharacterized membrane protein
MNTLKRHAFSIVLTVTAFALAALLYGRLPEAVPVHFDPRGTPVRFLSKGAALFIHPLIAALLLAVMIALEPLLARQPAPGPLLRVYAQLVAALIGLQLYLTVLQLLIGVGTPLDARAWSVAGAGVVVMVAGNRLGKLTRNRFMGIRTRWTLGSDEVWARTHRLGGWLFVLAGLLMCVLAALGHPAAGLLPLLAATLVTLLYAAHIGRQQGGPHGGGGFVQ